MYDCTINTLSLTILVWELTYTSIVSEITLLNKTPSNGTIAVVASMPGTRQLGILANIFQDESTGPLSRSSPDNFIRSIELGMSKAYSYPLASQLSGRPSLLTQTRSSKVVTRLPITALWSLVAASLLYVLIGLVIGLCAISELTYEVSQVKMRLSVVGLVATLFAREQSEEVVANEKVIFDNNDDVDTVKRVAVIVNKRKGIAFRLIE